MLDIFMHRLEERYYWYVLIDSHVLDQGTTKTKRAAHNQATNSYWYHLEVFN